MKPLEPIREWLPKLQAHRGVWEAKADQNTLKALKKAQALGYKMAEFDVRLTADNHVVLYHDLKIQGKKISRLSLTELSSVQKVSTLESVFEWVQSHSSFKLNIEIKNEKILNYKLEMAVVRLIEKFQLENQVIISCFNPFSLLKIKVLNAKIRRALLVTHEFSLEVNFFIQTNIFQFLVRPDAIHLRIDDYLKYQNYYNKVQNQYPVVLWTVNDVSLIDLNNVHGLISDRVKP
jgi:glycerophosphoryl diester phosphodiesterase